MSRVPFGKYRGEPIERVPDSYLEWLTGLELREPFALAVRREYARRLDTDSSRRSIELAPPVRELAGEIVARGFRALAGEHHPDHGGDHEAMVRLAQARDALRVLLGEPR